MYIIKVSEMDIFEISSRNNIIIIIVGWLQYSIRTNKRREVNNCNLKIKTKKIGALVWQFISCEELFITKIIKTM